MVGGGDRLAVASAQTRAGPKVNASYGSPAVRETDKRLVQGGVYATQPCREPYIAAMTHHEPAEGPMPA